MSEKKPGNPLKYLEKEAGDLAHLASKEIRFEVRRWPALLVLVLVGATFFFLSDRLTFGLVWVLISVLLLLTIPAIYARLKGFHQLNHWLLISLCGVITISETGSISALVASLPDKTIPASSLLLDAALLWCSNVLVFSLWYWTLDSGGPHMRSLGSHDYQRKSELLFPQMTLLEVRPELANWRPKYIDYLFVAFNTSTAFSPTDTPVLSAGSKH